jgi:hypothetical protein
MLIILRFIQKMQLFKLKLFNNILYFNKEFPQYQFLNLEILHLINK